MLPKIKFNTMSLDMTIDILSWSAFRSDGANPVSDATYYLYPELKGKLKSENDKNNLKVIKNTISDKYYSNYDDLNGLSKRYLEIWEEYNDIFMKTLSTYFEIKWPNGVEEINAFVGNIPVCPRDIEGRMFGLLPFDSDEMLIDVCMHECCHFLFFEKCKQIFSNRNGSDYDSPSLLWYLSEIVIDPILNNDLFQNIFKHNFKCYESFYKVKIGDNLLLDLINELFKENKIEDAIKKSYLLLQENEMLIREQCNDRYDD